MCKGMRYRQRRGGEFNPRSPGRTFRTAVTTHTALTAALHVLLWLTTTATVVDPRQLTGLNDI